MMKEKLNQFSVPLGLLDYINPIFYSITIITIIKNMCPMMASPYNVILLIGAIISIFFGFVIPTGKVLVGFGVIEFKMPVPIVFSVNAGILLSGLMLLKQVMKLEVVTLLILVAFVVLVLTLLYSKTKKANTIAVLTGAVGYLLLYISLITLSLMKKIALPIVLYAFAILLFIMLCGIGIKANLKNPKVHWMIEVSNVICKGLVAAATLMLF